VAVVFLVTLIIIACALVGISGTLKRIEWHNSQFLPAPPEEPEECASCKCREDAPSDAL
jgi:hypothetical protein